MHALRPLGGSVLLCLMTIAPAFSQDLSSSTAVPRIISPADYETVRSTKVVQAVRIHERINLEIKHVRDGY